MKRITALALITVAAGCTGGTSEDLVGAAQLTITQVPASVSCVQIGVTNGARSVLRSFDVAPNTRSVERLDGLPVIADVFTGFAYPTSCDAVDDSSVPSYLSDEVDALVRPGALANVTLLLRQNGAATVSVDFDDSCASVSCPSPAHGIGTCQNGVCSFYCQPDYRGCGDTCIRLRDCCTPDDCSQVANGQAVCTSGQCSTQCDTGYHQCSGRCVSASSVDTCGASCTPCPLVLDGSPTCDGNACGIACDSGAQCPDGHCPTPLKPCL